MARAGKRSANGLCAIRTGETPFGPRIRGRQTGRSAMRKPELLGILQVMLAAILWGTVGVATKTVETAGTLPQETLALARLAVGGPALLVVLLVIARDSLSGVRRINLFWLGGFAIGCAVFQICLFRAFALLGVTVTVFLTVCLPPIMTTLWSVLRRDRGATGGIIIALTLASLGLTIFAMDGLVGFSGGGEGLLLALIGSAAFVMMTFAARKLARTTSALAVAAFGLTASALALFTILPLSGPVSLFPTRLPDPGLAALVLYLGLGPTALAYVLYCGGMSRCRSALLGLVASMIEPVFAAMLAWAVLNERLSLHEAFGCALVTLAMLTLWRSEQRMLKAA